MTNNMLKAVKRFNKVMNVCEDMNVLEIKEDGTLQAYYDSEFRPTNVNVEDLIKESKYQLSLYYEGGHSLNDLRYEDSREWWSRVGKLERLIKFLNECKE